MLVEILDLVAVIGEWKRQGFGRRVNETQHLGSDVDIHALTDFRLDL